MKRTYLSESHKNYVEASLKSLEEMSKHPLSREQMKAQCDAVEKASKGRAVKMKKK